MCPAPMSPMVVMSEHLAPHAARSKGGTPRGAGWAPAEAGNGSGRGLSHAWAIDAGARQVLRRQHAPSGQQLSQLGQRLPGQVFGELFDVDAVPAPIAELLAEHAEEARAGRDQERAGLAFGDEALRLFDDALRE